MQSNILSSMKRRLDRQLPSSSPFSSDSASFFTYGNSGDDESHLKELNAAADEQDFWKYHVMKLNPLEFYMTTNPDKRHRFVRHAPSYYVEIQLPLANATGKHHRNGQASDGFRLIFTQQEWGKQNNPSFSVEKISTGNGGGYKVTAYYNEQLGDNGAIISLKGDKNQPEHANLQFDRMKGSERYYGDDLDINSGYRLGSKLKVCTIKQHRKNYLFKAKIDGIKAAKKGSVYFMDSSFFKKTNWFNQIVAVFRPCKREITSKIAKQVITSSSRLSGFTSSSVRIGGNRNGRSSMDSTRSETDDDNTDYDLEYTTYNDQNRSIRCYLARDGLRDRHPVDDSPNDYKVGWITVYDKEKYFNEKTEGGGNWEVVLGMTLAVGIEGMLDEILKSSRI